MRPSQRRAAARFDGVFTPCEHPPGLTPLGGDMTAGTSCDTAVASPRSPRSAPRLLPSWSRRRRRTPLPPFWSRPPFRRASGRADRTWPVSLSVTNHRRRPTTRPTSRSRRWRWCRRADRPRPSGTATARPSADPGVFSVGPALATPTRRVPAPPSRSGHRHHDRPGRVHRDPGDRARPERHVHHRLHL